MDGLDFLFCQIVSLQINKYNSATIALFPALGVIRRNLFHTRALFCRHKILFVDSLLAQGGRGLLFAFLSSFCALLGLGLSKQSTKALLIPSP